MHSISLEERKNFVATEIKEVLNFSEDKVEIVTKTDDRILIVGENMKINGFLRSSGAFSLSGKIKQIRYSGAKESVIKKLFR